VKGDARFERQSSSVGRFDWSRYVQLAFAGFLFLHLACQAYRAWTDGLIPQAGIEGEPWAVAIVLFIVWLPFMAYAARELSRRRSPVALGTQGNERALRVVEPVALAGVMLFALVHGAQLAWPLLAGHWLAADVRPELIASLSATWRGVPGAGIAYLSAVGAGAFYATRQALKAFPGATPTGSRAIVLLGVLGYLLGSYAVIRCASGTLLR